MTAPLGIAAKHRADPGYTPFPADPVSPAEPVSPADPVSLAALFWRQVHSGPDRVAVLAEDGDVSYAQLGERVAAIAAALDGERPPAPGGPAPGTGGRRVGLLLDHGTDTVAGILGTLTAGAAYVPLDPRYPVDRLALMLADAEADTLLVTAAHAALAETLLDRAGRPPTRVLDVTALPPAPHPVTPVTVAPDAPAYLLYTSGSTGVPKGVAQTQRNALFQIRSHVDNLRIGPGDRVTVLSSYSFDMAVTDTFSALLTGAASVPVDLRDTGLTRLAEVLADRAVTVYHSTPTVYRYLLAAIGPVGRLPSVRAILLGGEEVIRDDLVRFRRHFAGDCVFINGYGATEISFAAQNHLSGSDVDSGAGTGDGVVPIGFPLAGTDVHLLAPDGRPDPVSGEIAIRSKYLAHYWRDPERNAQRFTVDTDGVRTFLTGDLGRWLPDGRLGCLGRLDRQVKVRGHRVELGEVEAALVALPEVEQAAVVARAVPGPAGPELRIVAYLLAAPDTVLRPAAVRTALERTLPAFALPQALVPLRDFPLTPTGKVDVRALPPEPARIPRPLSSTVDVWAGSPTGTAIAAAWRDVLGRDDAGPAESFFDLGGHSLLMGQVQELLESTLGRRIPLTTLYAYPTIAGLARHLDGTGPADRDGDRGAADRMARRRAARSTRGSAETLGGER